MNNPIVFIHGSGDSAWIWQLQLEHFHNGRQAYAIDLPGYGQRPDTLPGEATVVDYAKAMRGIVQDELHLNRPIIAGNSLGGAIALTMALEYAAELGGLILIGTGARLRVLPALLETARLRPEEAHRQLVEAGVSPTTDAAISEAIVNEQVTPGSHIVYRDLAACNVFDAMARLGEISLPALIICGSDDRLTPVKYSQFLHEHINGSMLRVIPHAGHYVMREQPEAVNSAIGEWLNRQ